MLCSGSLQRQKTTDIANTTLSPAASMHHAVHENKLPWLRTYTTKQLLARHHPTLFSYPVQKATNWVYVVLIPCKIKNLAGQQWLSWWPERCLLQQHLGSAAACSLSLCFDHTINITSGTRGHCWGRGLHHEAYACQPQTTACPACPCNHRKPSASICGVTTWAVLHSCCHTHTIMNPYCCKSPHAQHVCKGGLKSHLIVQIWSVDWLLGALGLH